MSHTIPALAANYTINVPITSDVTAEVTEDFTINLNTLTNAKAGDMDATGTINDDDVVPFTWVGTGGDDKSDTLANWSSGVVPNNLQTALFNGACSGAACAATW